MEGRYALTHSVDGLCIPVRAEHSRSGGEIFQIMVLFGGVAALAGWFFEASYWGYFMAPVFAGVVGCVYQRTSYPKWRRERLTTNDIADLRKLLASADRFDIRLSPLPSPTSEMTHGELEDWAETANKELQRHYRALLSAESDVVAKKVSS